MLLMKSLKYGGRSNMKKKLLSLLLVPLMLGCTPNNSFVDEYILPVLGDLTLNTVEYDTPDISEYFGDCNIALIDYDMISYAYVDGPDNIIFEIYIEETRLTSFTVWSFDITYTNLDDNVTAYWEFMHEDEWFTEDQTPETIDMNYLEFAKALVKLTKNDLVYLVGKLEEF